MFPIFNRGCGEVKIRIFVIEIAWIHNGFTFGFFANITEFEEWSNQAIIIDDRCVWFWLLTSNAWLLTQVALGHKTQARREAVKI